MPDVAIATEPRSWRVSLARHESSFFADGTIVAPAGTLCEAAARSNLADLQSLLEGGLDLDVGHAGVPPILWAARVGCFDAVRLLLDHSANPNACAVTNECSWAPAATYAPIHCAAQRDDIELIGLLLAHDAEIGVRATQGLTALHFASYHGSLAAVQQLIAHGADVHARDESGLTPLDDARHQLLYARRVFACPCARSAEGVSEKRASLESTVALLERATGSASPQARAALARQAWEATLAIRLIDRAERGDVAVLRRLLHYTLADVNACDCDGSTALHAACEEGHSKAAALLLDRGAHLHARNHYSDTPLHVAAHKGCLATTWLLCACGADLHATNRFGKTPLECAQHAGARQGMWLAVVAFLHAARLLVRSTNEARVLCHDGERGRESRGECALG